MLNFPPAYPRLALPCRSVADNFLTPLAEMRPTPGAGFGAFAVAPIPAGTIVACFRGTLMDRPTFDTMPADRRSRSIQIDDDAFFLGPVEREPGDAVNHSCDPNCGMGGASQVVAMRDIAVGEALTFDYAMADGSNYDEFDCACGTALCRSRVSGSDWSRPDLHARYANLSNAELARVKPDPIDGLSHWALDYLSHTRDRSLQAMLDAAVERWVKDILACAPLSVKAVKQMVRAGAQMSPREAQQLKLPALIAALNSTDQDEGVKAFLEKRAPVWQGR
mgnify:CR=1 FL=1